MKILITGAGGYLGRHMIEPFERSGHELRLMDVRTFDSGYRVGKHLRQRTGIRLHLGLGEARYQLLATDLSTGDTSEFSPVFEQPALEVNAPGDGVLDERDLQEAMRRR